MQTQQIFEFNGQQVEFDLSSANIMVNANEMAKIFGKLVPDFLRLDQTKSFINEALNNGNSHYLGIQKEQDLYISKQRSGTWMHRVLALKFAAWLDPAFELWVYITIDQLMQGKLTEEVGFWKSQYEVLAENARQMIEADDLGKEKTKEAKDYFKKSNELKHSILGSLSTQQLQLTF